VAAASLTLCASFAVRRGFGVPGTGGVKEEGHFSSFVVALVGAIVAIVTTGSMEDMINAAGCVLLNRTVAPPAMSSPTFGEFDTHKVF
jgi:hypothetical protein